MAITKGIVAGGNYTFSAATQTITFSSDYLGMSLSDITYITNIASGVATVIYDPFDPTKGGTLSGLVLTLAYNTVAMSDSDPLQIIVGFTPSTATPQNVNIAANYQLESQIELLQSIADDISMLAKAQDQFEKMPIEIRDSNPSLRDADNAEIASDSIIVSRNISGPSTFTLTGQVFEVDTKGYNTVIFVCKTGTTSPTVNLTVDSSTDRDAWIGVPYSGAAGGGTLVSQAAGSNIGLFSANSVLYILVSNVGRYTRVRFTALSSGSVSVYAVLRNLSFNAGLRDVPQNLTSISGTQPFMYGSTTSNPATGTTVSGGIAISGGFQPTTNTPTTSSLSGTVPWPIGIGGREQGYIGALAGLFRYITVDGGGRYILGGDTPDTETRFQSKKADGSIAGIPPRGVGVRSNTMMGSQALLVQDIGQSEGDTTPTLLQQILVELKMLNQQINELPLTMNLGIKMQNEVGEYRQEEYNNHVNNQ